MSERVASSTLIERIRSHDSSSGPCVCEHCKERLDLLDARAEIAKLRDLLKDAHMSLSGKPARDAECALRGKKKK